MLIERSTGTRAAPPGGSEEDVLVPPRSPPGPFFDGYEAATRWPKQALTRLKMTRDEVMAAAEMLRGLTTSDRSAIIDAFLQLAPLVARVGDRDAVAYSVGAVVERGVGLAPISGRFLRYARARGDEPARLLSGVTRGSVKHLSAGVSGRFYCASSYGSAAELSAERLRVRGYEAGLGPVALSATRGQGESAHVRGLSLWFTVGLNVGPVPLSGIGLLDLEDRAETSLVLSADETRKLEAALGGAKSWAAWHRIGRGVNAPFRAIARGLAHSGEATS